MFLLLDSISTPKARSKSNLTAANQKRFEPFIGLPGLTFLFLSLFLVSFISLVSRLSLPSALKQESQLAPNQFKNTYEKPL